MTDLYLEGSDELIQLWFSDSHISPLSMSHFYSVQLLLSLCTFLCGCLSLDYNPLFAAFLKAFAGILFSLFVQFYYGLFYSKVSILLQMYSFSISKSHYSFTFSSFLPIQCPILKNTFVNPRLHLMLVWLSTRQM